MRRGDDDTALDAAARASIPEIPPPERRRPDPRRFRRSNRRFNDDRDRRRRDREERAETGERTSDDKARQTVQPIQSPQ
jgi:hypothetical protein